MSEVDRAWWHAPVAVLRLVGGSFFAALTLLGAFLTLAEGSGTVRALLIGGGAIAIAGLLLGWGMKGLWPGPGEVVQLATGALLLPVTYLAALDAYGMAETTTLVLFAGTILLVAVPVAVRLRRSDPPLEPQVVTGDELVLRSDRLTALIGVELCLVALVGSVAAIRYAPVLMVIVGWAGVVLFGALALWVARGLTGWPVITADAGGVTDRSRFVGWGRIDWDEIARFTTATRGVAVVPRAPQDFAGRTRRRGIQMRLSASVEGLLLSTVLVAEDRWLATELLEGARRRWQTR